MPEGVDQSVPSSVSVKLTISCAAPPCARDDCEPWASGTQGEVGHENCNRKRRWGDCAKREINSI
eukprot:6196582-Pleurochrysis_carterae.AAC.1